MAPSGVAVTTRSFSWGRALLHALLPVALAAGAGLLAVVIDLVPSAKAAGMLVAGASFFLVPAGFVASWLLQTGRRGCGLTLVVLSALGVVVVAGGLLALPLIARLTPSAVGAEEQHFETYWAPEGQRLRHPTLGFSLPAPSGRFAADAALAEELHTAMMKAPSVHVWVYHDPSNGERIILLLEKGSGETKDEFESFTRGFQRDILGREGVSLLRDEVRWNGGRGDYLLQTAVQGTIHFEARCIASGPREPSTYVVCVAISSRSSIWSRRFLAGLEPEGADAPPSP